MLGIFRELRFLIGGEAKVLCLVLGGLLCGEVGMRCIQDRLSVDVQHLESFHRCEEQLNEDPIHPHVLFLGNSMTRYGISPDVFNAEFAERSGKMPASMKINPDNTALADWYYAYRNYFYETQHAPDVLVIGFEGGHLRDKPSGHPGRLAQYYCDAGDWNDLCRFDLPTFEDRLAYEVCKLSAMCSNRDRLQRRALDTLVPGYRDGSQLLNIRQSGLAEKKLPQPTYHRLRKFLEMTRQQHVQVVFAAMPIAAPYELDPQLLELIQQEHATLIDCRHIPGITPAMFPDGVHMTSEASCIYSKYLADVLAGSPPPRVNTPVATAAAHP